MRHMRQIGKAAKKLGFTLIELSIVLVIIGLIVGGILVGQDLIRAAEIRATVSQLEKYSTAVNAFRGKYNGLPGDLLNATNFGFETAGAGLNDGDAIIESAAGTSAEYEGETSCFWDYLSTANLIAESLNGSGACGATTQSPAVLGNAIPITKLGRGNYIIIGSTGGINYWGLTGVTGIASGVYTLDDLLTGSEAFQIDSKIDDGVATTGSVAAVDATTGGNFWITLDAAGAAGAGECVLAGNLYNFTTSGGNDQACQLRIRTNF